MNMYASSGRHLYKLVGGVWTHWATYRNVWQCGRACRVLNQLPNGGA
jgi:hypothetical protein